MNFTLWAVFSSLAVGVSLALLLRQWESRRLMRKRRLQPAPATPGQPPIAVIVALSGTEHQLRENLAAWLHQDYFPREVIFVAEHELDPAVPIARALMQENRFVPSQLVIAGTADRCGQRAHQLLAGLASVTPGTPFVAFSTADAKARSTCLRWMVAGLMDARTGIVTGGNWAIPRHQTLVNRLFAAAHNRAAGFASAGPRNRPCPSAWAIRRELFDSLCLRAVWSSVLCEQWPTARAIAHAGQGIRFEPNCLTESTIEVTWRRFADSLHRDSVLQRTYAPATWASHLLSRLSIVATLAGTAAIATRLPGTTSIPLLPALLVAVAVLAMGTLRSNWRNQATKYILPVWKNYRSARRLDLLAWPLVDTVGLAFQLAGLFSHTIRWRGKRWRIGSIGTCRLESSLPYEGLLRRGGERHEPTPAITSGESFRRAA